MNRADWPAVEEIYRDGIGTGHATFERFRLRCNPGARRGVGNALLGALVDSTEKAGIWTIQAGIFPENSGSLRLHTLHGFRIVGRRERLALMSYGPSEGTWRDVLLVERRSTAVAP